jgi:hypothetical protein
LGWWRLVGQIWTALVHVRSLVGAISTTTGTR